MNQQIPEITLNDGLKVPAIGLGTYTMKGAEGVNLVAGAIDLGYRLIDTAFNYENEGAVGEAVKRSSVPREELLICSKLPGRRHAYQEALVTIEESLYRAGLDYYDLYLIIQLGSIPIPKAGDGYGDKIRQSMRSSDQNKLNFVQEKGRIWIATNCNLVNNRACTSDVKL